MKGYNKNVMSSCLQYQDANHLYGWAMSKKLPVREFTWGNIDLYMQDMIKNFDEDGRYSALLEVDIQYSKVPHALHIDLSFLAQRKALNKAPKLITSLENKKEYVVHISTLKQALNHGLKLTKVHRVIKYIQTAWMKSYIDKNTKLRMPSKNEFDKTFYKLMRYTERQWKM